MNYIVGNWKSNKNLAESLNFLDELKTIDLKSKYLESTDQLAIIAAPYPFVAAMQEKIKALGLNLKLAVQDLSGFGLGAYTGQICAENLKELGVEYAILGHSERRLYNHETHEEIGQKVAKALAANITPILCLDEPYIKEQSQFIPPSSYSQLIIAFEPLSAIGTGQSMNPAQVELTYSIIKETFGENTPLLYGGSVTPETVSDYLHIGNGVLVGSASLKAESFHLLNVHQNKAAN